MSEDWIKIEVDGRTLEVRKGAMLIEATDAAGIYVPRFCYHNKLSVAANCRMCLVDVEKAPKPVPACATPVVDGMKVSTESRRALEAQKGVMEFLLINHPLDCPICDQGGECELQDLALGFGCGVARFSERKRVVKDKDVGPLIKTEMTRCIHCTRCVRFGEEIAGLRELGATGRGENMEIGTYISKSIVSELSGNVIDICPVGALTARPSRYSGRSWEYVQHPYISPHDSVGSNLYLHTFRGRVMRAVPRENEAVNEVWISDRDRFSYQGIYSDDRALRPQVNGAAVEWETALQSVRDGLKNIIDRHGPDAVGFLVSPTATVEEMYLAQKLARGLGVANIDHRLRQDDFGDQGDAPVFPWLGCSLEEMETLDAALLIGSNVRMEQPLAGHRIRKAALKGARIMFVNPRDFDFRFPVAAKIIADPAGMVSALAGVAAALAELKREEPPSELKALIGAAKPGELEKTIAGNLLNGKKTAVMLGNLAVAHPAFSSLRALAGFISQASGASLGYLPEAAGSAGGWLAGVLPHRLAGGKPVAGNAGLDARAMLESPRRAYVLLGVEPGYDCWDPATALAAIEGAEFVVSLSPYAGQANVLLPIGSFAETSGSYVNAEGRWQSFHAAIKPLGEARPAWKVLRVLGNAFELPSFDYLESTEVLAEVQAACQGLEPDNRVVIKKPPESDLVSGSGLLRVGDAPIYAVDALVRRGKALQQTPLARPAEVILNPDAARELGLAEAAKAKIWQNGVEAVLPLVLDASVPRDAVWVSAGLAGTERLGPMVGPVEIGPAE